MGRAWLKGCRDAPQQLQVLLGTFTGIRYKVAEIDACDGHRCEGQLALALALRLNKLGLPLLRNLHRAAHLSHKDTDTLTAKHARLCVSGHEWLKEKRQARMRPPLPGAVSARAPSEPPKQDGSSGHSVQGMQALLSANGCMSSVQGTPWNGLGCHSMFSMGSALPHDTLREPPGPAQPRACAAP